MGLAEIAGKELSQASIAEKELGLAEIAGNSSDRLFWEKGFGSKNHLREKNIAGPTERSQNALAFCKLGGEDLRFSMKMMFAAGA